MFYLKKEERKAVDTINNLTCIRRDQLVKMGLFDSIRRKSMDEILYNFDKLSNNTVQDYFKIEGDIYVSNKTDEVNLDVLTAINVLISFDNITWYGKSKWPYAVSFTRTGNQGITRAFEIIVLKPGEEALVSRVLEDSELNSRLLVIIDEELVEEYKPLNTNKFIRYCLINPVRLYESLDKLKIDLL